MPKDRFYNCRNTNGKGKTEAALACSEFRASKSDRCGFFGLPTQATSNGMFSRMESWLETLFEETGDSKLVRLQHGKAVLNDDFEMLRNRSAASGMDFDSSEASTVIVNEWFSVRKTATLMIM